MAREFLPNTSPLSPLAQQAVLERARIECAIYEQRAIVEVADLREAVLKQMHPASAPYALPVEAQLAN